MSKGRSTPGPNSNTFLHSVGPSESSSTKRQRYNHIITNAPGFANAGHGHMTMLDVNRGRTSPLKRKKAERGPYLNCREVRPRHENSNRIPDLVQDIYKPTRNLVNNTACLSRDNVLGSLQHNLAGDSQHRIKPKKHKGLEDLCGKTPVFSFFVEDGTDDETHDATHQGQASRDQMHILDSAMTKAEERRRSQELRAQAMRKKRNAIRPSTPNGPFESVQVIDLCSPTRSTFEENMEHDPRNTNVRQDDIATPQSANPRTSPVQQPLKEVLPRRVEQRCDRYRCAAPLATVDPQQQQKQQQQQQQREERIKKMQLRNQQNRDSAHDDEVKEAEPVSVMPSPAELDTKPHMPTLPHSDSHRSEVHKLRSDVVDTSRRPDPQRHGVPSSRADRREPLREDKMKDQPSVQNKPPRHCRKLGEIAYEDFKLLDWRRAGKSWDEITQLFETTIGKKRVSKTLKTRCIQVQNALKDVGIAKSLIAQAIAGDEHSIGQINISVRQQSQPENSTEIKIPSKALFEGQISRRAPQPTVSNPGPGISKPFSDGCTQTLPPTSEAEETSLNGDPLIGNLREPSSLGHPTTGGKTISWENWTSMLHFPHEDSEKEGLDSEQKSDDGEQIGEDDFCHFEYQVQRRECTSEEFGNGVELDDVPWMNCQRPLETLAQANMNAAKQVYRALPGGHRFADPEGDFIVSQKTGVDGMKVFSLENRQVGTVETRVIRNMRLFHEGILPRSNEGMMRRIGYLVKWRVTRNSTVDELFEGRSESVDQGILDAIYTILDIANQQAISHFVELTFKSPIANLNVRRQEKQQIIKGLLEGVEGDVNGFRKTSGEGTERKVDVWVEVLPIKGPRNLY